LVALSGQEKYSFFLQGFPLLSGLKYKKPLKANSYFLDRLVLKNVFNYLPQKKPSIDGFYKKYRCY